MKRYISIIILLICFHSVNNIIWTRLDGGHVLGNYAIHHLNAVHHIGLNIRDIFSGRTEASRFFSLFNLPTTDDIFYGFPLWPGGAHIFTALFQLVFGHPQFSVKLANIIVLAILLFFTFMLTREFSGMDAGIWACIILSMYPGIYGVTRKYEISLHLTAVTVLCLFLFLKTDYLIKRRPSLLFGLILGTGFLIKIQFIFYIYGILLYALYRILRSEHRKERLLNLAGASAAAITVSSMWWYGHASFIFQRSRDSIKDLISSFSLQPSYYLGDASGALKEYFMYATGDVICPCTQIVARALTLKWFAFYIYETLYYISPVLLLLGTISFLSGKNKIRDNPYVILWIFLPYPLLTLGVVKWGVFCLPVLPAIAILMAQSLCSIQNTRYRRILKILFLAAGLTQFFWLSYARPTLKNPGEGVIEGILPHRPIPTNYDQISDKIINIIDGRMAGAGSRIGIIDTVEKRTRITQAWYDDLTYYLRYLIINRRPRTVATLFWDTPKRLLLPNYRFDHIIFIRTRNSGISFSDWVGGEDSGSSDMYEDFQLLFSGILEPDGPEIQLLGKPQDPATE